MPKISWEVGDFFMFEEPENHLSYGVVVSPDGGSVTVRDTGMRTGRYVINHLGSVPENAVPFPLKSDRVSLNFEIKMALYGAIVSTGRMHMVSV